MKKLIFILCLFFTGIFLFQSCLNDHFDYEPPYNYCDTTYYYLIIRPVIATNCANEGCHDGKTDGTPGNFNFFGDLKDRIDNGKVQERLDLPVSDLLHMPYQIELDPDTLKVLTDWIANGYPGCDLTGK